MQNAVSHFWENACRRYRSRPGSIQRAGSFYLGKLSLNISCEFENIWYIRNPSFFPNISRVAKMVCKFNQEDYFSCTG